MLLLLILADDFTGALDTGVQFAACGIPTRVVVGEQVDLAASDAAVLVVDTETRHLPAAEAYAVIAKLTRDAMSAGVFSIYKRQTLLCAETRAQSFRPCSKTSGGAPSAVPAGLPPDRPCDPGRSTLYQRRACDREPLSASTPSSRCATPG